jgi:NAD(P)-dependent dehydrogenase (short-subunit alcohol dehydrogenase family)
MSDRVALVTGGTTGIGRATVLAFAKRGYATVFCGRREAEGKQTEDMLQAAGGRGRFIQTDVCDEAAVRHLIGWTLENYGQLDCAFNNAGVTGPMRPTIELTPEEWASVMSINVTGTWLCMKYQIPAMLKRGRGAIVNMASVSGIWGTPGLAAYVAAKHAVLGLTKTAAIEYAPAGLRINAVAPAGIMTEIISSALGDNPVMLEKFRSAHPLGRFGTAEEVAAAVLWLCSDESSFVAGNTLMIDGGATAGVNPFK